MQTIDLNALFLSMRNDLEALGLKKTPEVLAAFNETNANAQRRLTPLVTGLASGDIDEEFVNKQFADEPNIWAAELISYEVIGAEIAQEARDQILSKVATVVMAILMQLITKI